MSFTHGVFPGDLKIAKVIPLFKSGDHLKVNNYRPVSILPVLWKVLEKLMYNRLMAFIEKFKIQNSKFYMIFNSVSGKHILQLLNWSISRRLQSLRYDKSWYLFQKLQCYGIRGIALEWIKMYKSNRYQYVSLNSCDSCIKPVECGVPQGSILGPLLFLLYVNDLGMTSDVIFTVMFADDTSMFFIGTYAAAISTKFNNELMNVATWLQTNKLSLNVDKSNFIIFKCNKKDTSNVHIEIGGRSISHVCETKSLGVTIDDKLTWKCHTENISQKISKSLAIIYKLKPFVNNKTLLDLYHSLIYTYLIYYNIVWGTAYKTHLNPLIVLQNRVIRAIGQNSFRYPSTSLLYMDLKIVRFLHLNKYLTDVFIFKWKNALLPSIFDDYFVYNSSVHSYATRMCNALHVPMVKSNLGKNQSHLKVS